MKHPGLKVKNGARVKRTRIDRADRVLDDVLMHAAGRAPEHDLGAHSVPIRTSRSFDPLAGPITPRFSMASTSFAARL